MVISSPDSVRMTTVAEGLVIPVIVKVSSLVSSSSVGLVMVRGRDVVGVGVVSGGGVGAGVGVMVEVAWRRLLLADQMPKVITSPTAKPINMARMTSFFTVGLEINNRSW